MICCVLAGGFATRLYPLTKDQPKALLEVAGKPLMEYLLDDVRTIPQIERVVIVTNEKFKDRFQAWCAANPMELPTEIFSNGMLDPQQSLGAVSSIVQVVEAYGMDTDYLFFAADNLLAFSLKEFVEYQRREGGSCVLWHRETRLPYLRKTGVAHVENGVITRMAEKPENPEDQCAIPPFYIYTRELLASIVRAPEQGCQLESPGHLLQWLVRRHEIKAMEMPGPRYNIGDLESYYQVKEKFESGK